MSYTALENTPIVVNLPTAAKDTGWSIDGNIATHEACNAGYILLLGNQLIAGHIYEVSYSVLSVSLGYVQLYAGAQGGVVRNAPGLYVEQIMATGSNPKLMFYSNANTQIQQFNVHDTIADISNTKQTTAVYDVSNKKWIFRTISPDCGFSLGINSYTINQGRLYVQLSGTNNRNNFYGQQYQSYIQFVDNVQPAISKTFQSISIQSNQLMVTTDNGISTSLGQVSELSDIDFLKDNLSDAVSRINVFDKENIYAACFLRDANTDLLSGDVLRGNYMIVELTTTENTLLQLFTVNIISQYSPIGSR